METILFTKTKWYCRDEIPQKNPQRRKKVNSRLSMAICWFVGRSQFDICQIHGVSYHEVMNSVWIVVDLINLCDSIKIKFPCTHTEQNTVAQGLKKKIDRIW